jgi:hypothetical protein
LTTILTKSGPGSETRTKLETALTLARFTSFGLLMCFACAGCHAVSRVTEKIDVGTVINAHAVANAWNESRTTQIECEKATVIVPHLRSVIKGKRAVVVRYSDGSSYIKIEGESEAWQMY